MDIEQLNLEPVAEAGARKLKELFPHIDFTSGRRSLRDQARAMSQNVTLNNSWIYQTYTGSEAAISLQDYVDHHLNQTAKHYEDAFTTILEKFSSDQLTRLSKHLGGQAFDIRPTTQDADAIKTTAHSLTGLTKFLDKEGGLVRWHLQF